MGRLRKSMFNYDSGIFSPERLPLSYTRHVGT